MHLTDEHFVATPEGVAKLIDENTIGDLLQICQPLPPTPPPHSLLHFPLIPDFLFKSDSISNLPYLLYL